MKLNDVDRAILTLKHDENGNHRFTPEQLMDSRVFRMFSEAWTEKDHVPVEMVHRLIHAGMEIGYSYAKGEQDGWDNRPAPPDLPFGES